MSSYNIFKNGVGTRPSILGELGFFGNDAAWLKDDDTFAWDTTNVTPSLNNIGARPCIDLTNSGSTATDTAQFQATIAGVSGSGSILLATASQTYSQKGSFRMTTTTQEWAFGVSAQDTSIVASDTTDFLRLQKLTGATAFSLYYRKASGTAVTTGTFGPILAADTWYDYEIQVSKYNATTGSGRVKVYMGTDVALGGQLSLVFDQVISTSFPDGSTPKLSSFVAWRAGSAANVSGYMNYFGVQFA